MINNKGEEVGIIYGWYCTTTDKWYIGQTVNPDKRFINHIKSKPDTAFHRAIKKYGLDNFVYCVLEDNVLIANLNMKEMDWIEEFDSCEQGYNMTYGGGGVYANEYVKKKMSKNSARWWHYHEISEETRKIISEVTKNPSKEIRKKISDATKQQWQNSEIRNKMCEALKKSNYIRGKHQTEETKKKISLNCYRNKPVYEFDINGKLTNTYYNITNACNTLNIERHKLHRLCSKNKIFNNHRYSFEIY